MSKEEIANIFTYHAPFGDQAARYTNLRDEARALALLINGLCPDSREKSLAITSLQQSIMWANAAIAINENPVPSSGVLL